MMPSEIQQANEQEDKRIKNRAKSAYLPKKTQINLFKQKPFHQYTSNLMDKINNHILPNYQKGQQINARISDIDPQPNPLKIRWKALTIKHKNQQQKQIKLIYPKRQYKNHNRISFDTRNQKDEKQIKSNFKFPSQKALVPKEKIIPVKSKQKQRYQVQICRIIKDNRLTLYEQNTKEQYQFQNNQIKKYRGLQTQKQQKNPMVTFQYDGSLIDVNPFVKKNNLIECEAKQLEKVTIANLYHTRESQIKNQKLQKKLKIENPFGNFQNLQELQSKYLENFENIPWNPKVCHENFKRPVKRSIQKQIKIVKPDKNNVPAFKQCCDQNSIVKVVNQSAYMQVLITKPIKIKKMSHEENKLDQFLNQFQQGQDNNKQLRYSFNNLTNYNKQPDLIQIPPQKKNQEILNIKKINGTLNDRLKNFRTQKPQTKLSKQSKRKKVFITNSAN